MLCHTLDGFEAALAEQAEKVDAALVSAEINEIFEALLAEPLARVTPPGTRDPSKGNLCEPMKTYENL